MRTETIEILGDIESSLKWEISEIERTLNWKKRQLKEVQERLYMATEIMKGHNGN